MGSLSLGNEGHSGVFHWAKETVWSHWKKCFGKNELPVSSEPIQCWLKDRKNLWMLSDKKQKLLCPWVKVTSLTSFQSLQRASNMTVVINTVSSYLEIISPLALAIVSYVIVFRMVSYFMLLLLYRCQLYDWAISFLVMYFICFYFFSCICIQVGLTLFLLIQLRLILLSCLILQAALDKTFAKWM